MTTVRMTDRPDGWTTVSFPYDPQCIAILKDVSVGRREYDPKTKTWSVLTEIAETLTEALIAAGHHVGGETVEATPKPTLEGFFANVDQTSDGFDPKAVAAEFIASLPGQHVGKVFRAMARQLYPDLYARKS